MIKIQMTLIHIQAARVVIARTVLLHGVYPEPDHKRFFAPLRMTKKRRVRNDTVAGFVSDFGFIE
jgi:hypothetical protein